MRTALTNLYIKPDNCEQESQDTHDMALLCTRTKSLPAAKLVLSEEQRRMYAAEKLNNFRWISKLVATYSPYTLTEEDLASPEFDAELAEIGQFTEVAYSPVPIEFLLENFSTLNQPGFPLEGYHSLAESVLVSYFRGMCEQPAYISYRPSMKQLVVAISGTASIHQALQDLRFLRAQHPSGYGSVHTGFWGLYQGIKSAALEGVKKGFDEYEVKELVVTGHSMGGSLAYLLCLDLLADSSTLLTPGLTLKIAVFGAPRTGDLHLVQRWRTLVSDYKRDNGPDSLKEYSVKGYNDGVPSLPPVKIGYRHFSTKPFYTVGGLLFRVPPTECEHALFRVEVKDGDAPRMPQFPHGGHNYYNGRELEKFIRRIYFLEAAKINDAGWEDRYKLLTATKP